MPYQDLRDWIQTVEQFGELKTVQGADWNREIGAVTEVAARGETSNALLFDNIRDYPAGHRVLVGMNSSLKRQRLTTNLPLTTTGCNLFMHGKTALTIPRSFPHRWSTTALSSKMFSRERI
jgi:UbiD family decarboxylase